MDGWGGEVFFFLFFFCFCICTIPHSVKETRESDGGVLVEGVVRHFIDSFLWQREHSRCTHFFYSSSLTPFSSQTPSSLDAAYGAAIESTCPSDLAGSDCMYQYGLRPAMWLSENCLELHALCTAMLFHSVDLF
jgi:hypothetical protein